MVYAVTTAVILIVCLLLKILTSANTVIQRYTVVF